MWWPCGHPSDKNKTGSELLAQYCNIEYCNTAIWQHTTTAIIGIKIRPRNSAESHAQHKRAAATRAPELLLGSSILTLPNIIAAHTWSARAAALGETHPGIASGANQPSSGAAAAMPLLANELAERDAKIAALEAELAELRRAKAGPAAARIDGGADGGAKKRMKKEDEKAATRGSAKKEEPPPAQSSTAVAIPRPQAHNSGRSSTTAKQTINTVPAAAAAAAAPAAAGATNAARAGAAPAAKKQACQHWARGKCNRGDACRFEHVGAGSNMVRKDRPGAQFRQRQKEEKQQLLLKQGIVVAAAGQGGAVFGRSGSVSPGRQASASPSSGSWARERSSTTLPQAPAVAAASAAAVPSSAASESSEDDDNDDDDGGGDSDSSDDDDDDDDDDAASSDSDKHNSSDSNSASRKESDSSSDDDGGGGDDSDE